MKRIFVVGCSRSGTTLLQSILGANSEVATLPETAFFLKVFGDSERRLFGLQSRHRSTRTRAMTCRFRHILGVSGPDVNVTLNEIAALAGVVRQSLYFHRMSFRAAVREFVRILDIFANSQQKCSWIEKTPSHIHYLQEIQRYVSGPRIVHIVRDGVAVVASLRAAAMNYPDAHWAYLYDTLDRCIARWNQSLQSTLEWCNHPNHIVVRYEEFVNSPQAVVRALCNRVGLTYDDGMLVDRSIAVSQISTQLEPWKSTIELGIDVSNQTSISDTLTNREIAYIQKNLLPLHDLSSIVCATG